MHMGSRLPERLQGRSFFRGSDPGIESGIGAEPDIGRHAADHQERKGLSIPAFDNGKERLFVFFRLRASCSRPAPC